MVLKVELATEADAQRSAAIEHVAYGPNPLGAALFPPHPTPPVGTPVTQDEGGLSPRAKQLIALLRDDPVSCRWVKVVDTEIADPAEAMISFSCWYFYEKESPVLGPQVFGEGTNPEACEHFMGGMRVRRNERYAGRPFACKLPSLFVFEITQVAGGCRVLGCDNDLLNGYRSEIPPHAPGPQAPWCRQHAPEMGRRGGGPPRAGVVP
jgi:hypothetical protein